MITQAIVGKGAIKGFFDGVPSIVLSAILVAIAGFALYMAFVEDHVAIKIGAIAWLLLP